MNTNKNKLDVIIISTYKNQSEEDLQTLGKAMKEYLAPVCDGTNVEIVTKSPSAGDVRGKVLIGTMIPSYLAEVAEVNIEVNAQSFWQTPERFRGQLTEEEVLECLKYPKAYTMQKVMVNEFVKGAMSI